MPKVVDTARVTTPKSAIWRTCNGCGLPAPLPPGADRCTGCDRPVADITALEQHALAGWERAHRYAAVVGRIEAWAVLIPDVSDAERVAHIRQALTDLDTLNQHAGRP